MLRHTFERFGMLSAAMLVCAGLAHASTIDCDAAAGETDALVCADAELLAIDRRVGERFAEALNAARALDVDAEATVDAIEVEQRGYVSERKTCWTASDPRQCIRDSSLRREAALVSSWFLEEPIAEAAYYCGGNYADEVIVMFFDTALPAARIEYGDGIDVATLVRTGSGSRYDGTFGRWIWVKGNEATVVWSDGDAQHCESAE